MALRLILPNLQYKAALARLNLETLENRRNILALRFARQAKEHNQLSQLFKKNNQTHQMITRKKKIYSEIALTDRYKRSSIINTQKILNRLKNE